MRDKDRLEDFCLWAIGRLKGAMPYGPLPLAALFREFSHIEKTVTLRHTLKLVSSLGIIVDEVDYLNSGAVNMWKDDWYIHYSSHEPQATQKFSIFHELFEIIDKSLKGLVSKYPGLKEPYLSRCADRFAAAVLMPPDFLAHKMIATGCDAVILAQELELSHQALLISFAENLPDIAFGAALYDHVFTGFFKNTRVEEFVARLVVKSPQARYARKLCASQWLPARGASAVPASLVCMAVKNNLPVLCRPDHGGEDSEYPAILVRPIKWWREEAGRVLLLTVPDGEFHLIQPQVEKLKPLKVPHDLSRACDTNQGFWKCSDCPYDENNC